MKRRLLSLLGAVALILLLLLRSAETAEAARRSMLTAVTSVIPALFPFSVLSALLLRLGLAPEWGHLLRCPLRLLGLDENLAAPFLLGSLCGYPIGAVLIAELYAKGQLAKKQAEAALGFCSNASPSFIVAVVGGSMLRSVRLGFLLLAIHLLAALFAALTLSSGCSPPERPAGRQERPSFAAALTESVRSSAAAMLTLTGFLVLFGVLLALIRPYFLRLIPNRAVWALVSGALELTSGLSEAAELPVSFLLCSVLLGFSGLCVHCQVLTHTLPLGLSARPYFLGKLVQTFYSFLLALLLSPFLPIAAAVSTVQPAANAAIPFIFYLPFAVSCAIIIRKRRDAYAVSKKGIPLLRELSARRRG